MCIKLFILFMIIVAASSIKREEVMARSKCWTDRGVPYSQKKFTDDCHGIKYRTDCSGMVSMAWKVPRNYTTRNLESITSVISKNDMKSGDAFLARDYHVTLFEAWANAQKTEYWGYDECCKEGSGKARHRRMPVQWTNKHTFLSVRYNKIEN